MEDVVVGRLVDGWMDGWMMGWNRIGGKVKVNKEDG